MLIVACNPFSASECLQHTLGRGVYFSVNISRFLYIKLSPCTH